MCSMSQITWFFTACLLPQAGMFVFLVYGLRITDSKSSMTFPESIAKASNIALDVNLSLLILSMCSTVIRLANQTVGHFFPSPSGISLHKVVACFLTLFALIHGVSHFSALSREIFGSNINANDFFMLHFASGIGWSGVLLLCLLLLKVASMFFPSTRPHIWTNARYEEGLTFALLAMWALHSTFYVPRGRGDFMKPETPSLLSVVWTAAAALYAVERAMMMLRSKHRSQLLEVIQHPNSVVEIHLYKGGFEFRAGQNIILCCPVASVKATRRLMLTSAPEENHLSVHLDGKDPFTAALHDSLGSGKWCHHKAEQIFVGLKADSGFGKTVDRSPNFLPQIMISGPFGGMHENIFQHEVALMIGIGQGIMPFASILKSIWYQMNNPRKMLPLTKVYFFWICQEFESFEWFRSLLMAIECQDLDSYIEIYTYLDAPFDPAVATKNLINSTVNQMDVLTGLRIPTYCGPPEWDTIFQEIRQLHGSRGADVLSHGCRVVGSEIQRKCTVYSDEEFAFDWVTSEL